MASTRRAELLKKYPKMARDRAQSDRRGVMTSLAVDGNVGAGTPVFCPKGLKLDSPVVVQLMTEQILPQILSRYPLGTPLTLFMDNAPSHVSKWSSSMLRKRFPSISFEAWPAQSPDLNPLDFGCWGAMLEVPCMADSPDVPTLMAKIHAGVGRLKNVSALVTESFPKRLREVVAQEGGWIEMHLKAKRTAVEEDPPLPPPAEIPPLADGLVRSLTEEIGSVLESVD